ncbi:MAG: protein kinase [Planctomycetota bacterium]
MTLSRSPDEQERLIECVREALACMDRGETVDPHELCKQHPHLAGPLAEVLGLTDALTGLQQEALREDPLAGLLLADRYQLTECLGRGAMGVVYHADDKELRREVAVKILDARLFRDEAAEQRFQREAEALATLQHANVVAVYDRGRTPEGIHYLVMELLAGCTLASLLGESALGDAGEVDATTTALAVVQERMAHSQAESHWPRLVARWGMELAHGLEAAHAQQLVHRDVKPSNVFLAKPGRPVLLDFGIAARHSDERLTATQTTLGTPWYMPPEQVSAAAGGQQAAQPTLDIYGLGATLYHLLAGRPPYEGDATAVLAALANEDPTPIAKVRPDLPRDLAAIVEKCLERDPDRRYPTAAQLADDLDAFLRHAPVRARPLSSIQRRMRSWRRSPARPIAAIAVGLAMLVAGIALPILMEKRAEAFAAQKHDLYRKLPSVLAIEGWPDERVLKELHGEHEAAIAQLDAILALDPDDLPVRLWRACLLFDLDRRDEATRDLQQIATQNDSVYFRQLAARYAESDRGKVGAFAVSVASLPQPATAQERYVQGFHELRNRHVKGYGERADALLAEAADEYLPARDLRLLSRAVTAGAGKTQAEKRQRLRELYDETVALEAIYGGPTARTQAMQGTALVLQRRYQDALEPLHRSLELRPERHGPHQNLGNCYKRLNELDKAEHHLREALRLRPFAWNSRYILAQVLRERRQFDAALEIVMGLSDDGGHAANNARLTGSIYFDRAMHLRSVDMEQARSQAKLAASSWRKWLTLKGTAKAQQQVAMAEAFATPTLETRFLPFAQAMAGNTDSAWTLANLAFLVPDRDLTEEEIGWIQILLRVMARERAGDDQILRQQLDAEIDATLARFR